MEVLRKKNNLIAGLNSASKSSKNNSHKLFLKKHIVIESKNKNVGADKKNNNNCTLSANKKNNDDNAINNINLQMRNKLRELKKFNQMSNFQKMYNESKNPTKFYVLRNVFNNNDF